MKLILKLIFATCLGMLTSTVIWSQDTTDIDTGILIEIVSPTDSSRMTIDEFGNDIQELYGNVVVKHDSVFFKCDTAFIVGGQDLTAWGNIVITKSDSIFAFGDSLIYNTRSGFAILLSDKVVLQNGDLDLVAYNQLIMDVNSNLSYYTQSGFFQNDSVQIESKRATYFMDSDQLLMRDSVFLTSEQLKLYTDSILYARDDMMAHFISPTRMETDSQSIYCEDGYYNFRTEEALFSQNAQFLDLEAYRQGSADSIFYEGQKSLVTLFGNAKVYDSTITATGGKIIYDRMTEEIFLEDNGVVVTESGKIASDRMRYNINTEDLITEEKTWIADEDFILESLRFRRNQLNGISYAEGKVILTDLNNDNELSTPYLELDESTNEMKAYGNEHVRPVMALYSDSDTTFVEADTLSRQLVVLDTSSMDSTNELRGFYDVEIYGTSFSGISDSLYFNDHDSTFKLLGDPIVWTDSAQIIGDTMYFLLRDGRADFAHVIGNCKVLSYTNYVDYWNQIKGRELEIFFVQNEIHSIYVDGNAESLYFVEDDGKKFVGCNEVKCGTMKLFFTKQNIDRIKFLSKPDGKFKAIKPNAQGADFRLDGIQNMFDRKPQK